MRKGLNLLLIGVVFSLSLLACGKKEEAPAPEVEETVEQPEETEEQTEEVQEFEVAINVTGRWDDSSVVFELDTNLPDEAELMFTVSKGDYNTNDSFTAQDKFTVEGGHITTDGFSEKGEAFSGNYDLCVSMSLPRLQSDDVRSAIGEKGEYMTGSLVEESDITHENTVRALFSVSVGDEIAIKPESDYSFTIFAREDEDEEEEQEEVEESVQEKTSESNTDYIKKYGSDIVVAAKMTLDNFISDYKMSLATQNWTLAKYDDNDAVVGITDITYQGVKCKYLYVGTLNFDDSGKVVSAKPHYVEVNGVVLGDDGYCDDLFETLKEFEGN